MYLCVLLTLFTKLLYLEFLYLTINTKFYLGCDFYWLTSLNLLFILANWVLKYL